MTYKGMLLSALLVPVAVTSYGKESVDSRIQQLKEVRFQKETELSELGLQIDAKQGVIGDLFASEVYCIKKHYKSRDLSSHEKDELRQQVEKLNELFSDFTYGLISEEQVREFFKLLANSQEIYEGFERLKYLGIRNNIEQKLLKVLTKRYEECLQELIAIGQELEKFDKLVL